MMFKSALLIGLSAVSSTNALRKVKLACSAGFEKLPDVDDDLAVQGTLQVNSVVLEGSPTAATPSGLLRISTEGDENEVVTGVFPSHLHNKPCDDSNGGVHWMANSMGPGTPPNEVWVTIDQSTDTPDVDAQTANSHLSPSALSWVVHQKVDDTSPRKLCCDLAPEQLSSDEFVDIDGTAEWTADAMITVNVLNAEITATLTVTSIQKDGEAYVGAIESHLHVGHCDSPGGHWKLNKDEQQVLEENEVWVVGTTADAVPALAATASETTGTLDNEALSWVIHDAEGVKVLCAPFWNKEDEGPLDTGSTTAAPSDPGTTAAPEDESDEEEDDDKDDDSSVGAAVLAASTVAATFFARV